VNARKIAVITLAMMMAVVTAASSAQVDFYNYQQFGGAWVDAEKMPKNSSQDSLMCWAAAASNVLAWTGWTTSTGPLQLYQTDAIFKYYQDHWTNDGGLMEFGWTWWSIGTNPSQGWEGWSQVDVPGGGFFPNINFYTDYNSRTALSSIDSYLRAGRGVGLGIYTDSGGGHAITVWGFKYDTAYQPSDSRYYIGIYITDSDDSKYTDTPPDLRPYYNVQYNSADKRWYLQNYFGTSNQWYIGTVQGLVRNPDLTYWIGTSGLWHTDSKWGNGVPTSTKTAFIDNGTTVTISAAAQCKDFYVGYDSGTTHSGTVQLNSGGSLGVAATLYIGFMSGSTGTFAISGGPLSAASEYVGDGGAGTLNQNGSTNTLTSTLYVGYSSGGSGTYNLSAGQLNVNTGGSIRIGADGGTGRFAWLGGTIDTPSMVLGANGTLAMGFNFDMGSLTAGSLFLHGGSLMGLSSGALEITNGAIATQSSNISGLNVLRIGSTSGGGKYNMTTGQLGINTGGSIRIGADGGTGRFAWLGGTLDTPSMVLGANGTLAMGYDFNVGTLMSGGLFVHGGAVTGLSSAALEVTNGATATQNTSATLGIKNLTVGSASGTGKYTFSMGQINTGTGGSIRVGADGAPGRFEWFGGAMSTPSLVLGNSGTLAMGFNFGVSNLVNGSLFGNGTLTGMNNAVLEITKGAVATQGSNSVLNVHDLHIGSDQGGGTYSLSSGQLNVNSAGSIVVGADGAPGRFEWLSGGIDAASFVMTPGYSTLAMGFNFNTGSLLNGSLFAKGGTFSGLFSSVLEITNGATATQGGTDSVNISLLWAGFNGHSGSYVMNGGSLYTSYQGVSGNGTFTLNAGTNDIAGPLGVGVENGTGGTYVQNGGVCRMFGWIAPYNGLYVGFSGGVGTYNLQNGEIWAYTNEYVGHSSTGVFNQTGGTNNINQNLYVGYQWVSGPVWTGTYNLQDGALVVYGMEYVGYLGAGVFNQSGGTNTVTAGDGGLGIGGGTGPYQGIPGTYNLSGGLLTVSNECVGYYGNGTFVQTGGTHQSIGYGIAVGFGILTIGDYRQSAGSTTISNSLWLGYNMWSQGTYSLSGTGQLAAGTEYVGYYGSGTFNQSGGVHTVTNSLNIGALSGTGVFNSSGGSLTAKDINIGAQGAWNITNSAAATKITGTLSFGAGSLYSALPATQITMTGANLDIIGTVEVNLAGLANTQFIFDGGAADVSLFEVAGMVGGGFTNNFAVGALTLGSGTFIGEVQLIDQRDNGNRGPSSKESLFAGALLVNTGSWLDMHGYRLYVSGNVESLLDGYIADTRLRDTTIGGGYHLDAVYDTTHSWTRVDILTNLHALGYMSLSGLPDTGAPDDPLPSTGAFRALGAFGEFPLGGGPAIPEPGTIIMLGLGLIGLIGIARNRIR
jgi:hypothetical protein